jgi:hypothetical protein
MAHGTVNKKGERKCEECYSQANHIRARIESSSLRVGGFQTCEIRRKLTQKLPLVHQSETKWPATHAIDQ